MTCALLAALLVFLGMLFCEPILWVLGPGYDHLDREVVWYLGFLGAGFLSTCLWGIALSRSWVRHAWIHIPLTLLAQATGARLIDLSQLTGAIWFAAMSQITGIVIAGCLIWHGLASSAPVEAGSRSPTL
jgi:hypothetical protein